MKQLDEAGHPSSTLISEAFELAASRRPGTQTRAAHRRRDRPVPRPTAAIRSTSLPAGRPALPWNEDLDRLADAIAPTVAYWQGARACSPRSSPRSGPACRSSTRCATGSTSPSAPASASSPISATCGWSATSAETLARATPHLALMQIGDVVIGAMRPAGPGRPRAYRRGRTAGRADDAATCLTPATPRCSTLRWCRQTSPGRPTKRRCGAGSRPPRRCSTIWASESKGVVR